MACLLQQRPVREGPCRLKQCESVLAEESVLMQFSFISFHKRKLDQYLGDVKANVLRRLVISVNSQPSAPANYYITHTTSTSPYGLCHALRNYPSPGDDLMCGCK